jgi:hypothetical protein
MARLLAQQDQDLADGLVDQLALFGCGPSCLPAGGLDRCPEAEFVDGAFDEAGGDPAAAGLFHGALPGQLGLFRCQANERPDLSIGLRLLVRAGTFSPIQL